MPRKKVAAKTAQQIKRQKMLANLAKGRQTRKRNIQARKAAKAAGQVLPFTRQEPAAQQPKKGTSGKKRARKGTVTTGLASRAKRLANAIRSGRVAVRQGVTSVSKAQGATKRAKYQKFMSIYKGVRIPAKPTAKVKTMTTRYVYRTMPGTQGQSKFPYYLAAGYTARVGGGSTGPGVVRVIPKSGATPFAKLDEASQRKIVSFLNSETGKKLRGKGAKRQVSYQAIRQAIKVVRTGAGISKPKKQRASANYR